MASHDCKFVLISSLDPLTDVMQVHAGRINKNEIQYGDLQPLQDPHFHVASLLFALQDWWLKGGFAEDYRSPGYQAFLSDMQQSGD
jgi:hypothetical protein